MNFNNLLGAELPIIQAPMAGVQDSALALAASSAGALGSLNDIAPAYPLAATALAPLRKQAESNGSGDFSPLWCGQNASGCQEIPAAELTQALAAEL